MYRRHAYVCQAVSWGRVRAGDKWSPDARRVRFWNTLCVAVPAFLLDSWGLNVEATIGIARLASADGTRLDAGIPFKTDRCA